MVQRPPRELDSAAAPRLGRFDMRAFHAALDAARSVTSAVVPQALAWLGRTPESFLTSPPIFPEAPLPESGPGHVLRFDTRAVHAALNSQRHARGLTQWLGRPAADFVLVRRA